MSQWFQLSRFDINSSIPLSQAFSMYSCSVWPDIATIIGWFSFYRSCLIYRDASNPSINGILRSMNINPYENRPSVWESLTLSTAIWPLYASSMIDSILSIFNWPSNVLNDKTLKGSSSTIRILLFEY